jgi:hypothetical protein
MDRIDRAQDKEKWRALVDTVMNLWVPKIIGKFLSSEATGGASQEGLISMEVG